MEPSLGGILSKRTPHSEQPKPASQEQPRPAVPEQSKSSQTQKADFEDIAVIDARQRATTMQKLQEAAKKDLPAEEAVNKLNNAMSGASAATKKVEEELQDMEKFSEADIELAEQLLFNGFAQKDIEIGKSTKASFYTTNAAETELINELVFEFTKKHESQDGRIDAPQRAVDLLHQMYLLAISFRGFNGKDVSEARTRSLDLIKNACKTLNELELAGDLEKFGKLREEVKGAIKLRASEMKSKLAVATVDALSDKRFKFERTMFNIINKGDVFPKF